MRIPAVAASVVLVAGLGGCALLDDVGDSDLDDALELVPGDATSVTFAHPEDAQDLGIEGAGLSGDDVVWTVSAPKAEGRMHAYKMDEQLDLDGMGDDLVEAGYAEDEIAGHRHFLVEGQAAVVVVPDEHLLFVGRSREVVEAAVEVYEDDADSLTDAGTFDDLLSGTDDPHHALLVKDPDCDPGLSPARLEASGRTELGTPETMGFFIADHGDEAATSSVLVFGDDDSAATDFEARQAYLAGALLERTQEPLADIADWDIERDGRMVRIDYEYAEPGLARAAARRFDGFHACDPG